ncbi:hypothetical protein TNCV_1677741 [Trichonephila clavipes]|nr:hypothetical protein TNCV_1677741 [Trichonephila clavipes]
MLHHRSEIQTTGWARLTPPSSLQWVDKRSTKFAWELKTGGFASDSPPDRNICSCTSGPKVAYTQLGTVALGPHGLSHH